MDGAAATDAESFKSEYMAQLQEVKTKKSRLRHQLAELERRRDELENAEFDCKELEKRALAANGSKGGRPTPALRASYRDLFKVIWVGPESADGHRNVKFVLREKGDELLEEIPRKGEDEPKNRRTRFLH
mgnify:CR=1 FL=1